MALFTERLDRERNPLGGYEADGWDRWIQATTQQVREGREALRSLPLDNVGRYISVSAERDYGSVLADWLNVKRGRDERARDQFEVTLIAKVMSAYGAAQYARELEEAGRYPEDGRPVADVSAEYLRACIILAQYVGVGDATVAACRDDQDALMALRNTRV